MRVAIPCGSCGRSLRLEQTLLGGVVRCPLCFDTFEAVAEQAVPIPEAPPPAAVALPEPELPRLLTEEPEDAPAPRLDVPAREAPGRNGPRPPAPVRFTAVLSKGADRTLKGEWQGEASEDGLRFRRGRRSEVWVSVGVGNARYAKGNQLDVRIDGRLVLLTLQKSGTDQARLARDLAAFLNTERGPLDPGAYALPRSLNLVALAPLAVPLVALLTGLLAHSFVARLLWFASTIPFVGLCFGFLRRPAWTLSQRLTYGGVVATLSVVLLLGLVASLYRPYSVDPRHWQSAAPPGEGYRVLLPGRSHESWRFYGWRGTFTVVESRPTGMDFAVGQLEPVRPEEQFLTPVAFFESRKSEFLTQNYGTRITRSSSSGGGTRWRYDLVGRYTDTGDEDGEGQFVARLVRVDDRVYLVAVAGPRVSEDHPDVRKFLDSFATDSNPPPGEPDPEPPSGPEDLGGLLVHYTFEETRADLKVKGGQLKQGASTDATGVRDKGLDTAKGYFTFDAGIHHALKQPFTVVAWVKPRSNGCILCLFESNNPGGSSLTLQLERGNLMAEVRTGEFDLAPLQLAGGVLDTGAWHHVALCRLDDNRFDLYVDGRRQGNGRQLAVLQLSPTQGTLGVNGTKLQTPMPEHLDAVFDDVAVFNRVLAPDEIANLARRK